MKGEWRKGNDKREEDGTPKG